MIIAHSKSKKIWQLLFEEGFVSSQGLQRIILSMLPSLLVFGNVLSNTRPMPESKFIQSSKLNACLEHVWLLRKMHILVGHSYVALHKNIPKSGAVL